MSNHQEISSFIWNVCDDVLRGLFKPTEYRRVILPFTVLRRLDCVLEPNKDEVYIYESQMSFGKIINDLREQEDKSGNIMNEILEV